jgi:hypothetical protein
MSTRRGSGGRLARVQNPRSVSQECEMGEGGKKDKAKREDRKKPQLSAKEKRKQKKEKKDKR